MTEEGTNGDLRGLLTVIVAGCVGVSGLAVMIVGWGRITVEQGVTVWLLFAGGMFAAILSVAVCLYVLRSSSEPRKVRLTDESMDRIEEAVAERLESSEERSNND